MIIRLILPSLLLMGCVSQFALADMPISPVDASHLVERVMYYEEQIPYFTTRVEETTDRGFPAYIVYGQRRDDAAVAFQSLVNAHAARVMTIHQDGDSLYRWPGPKVVGHRGNVYDAPENTLAALDAGIRHGCEYLEIDIRQTKDGVLVLMHDVTLDRTTDGSGPVSELTWDEIKNLDAGSWFGEGFAGTRIPTLEEALRHIKGRAIPDIDFKEGDPEELVRVMRKEGFLGDPTIHAGTELTQALQRLAPGGFLFRPGVRNGVLGLPKWLDSYGDAPIVNIDWVWFNEELVRKVHLLGRDSFLNTMQHENQFGIEAMVDMAPDYIQTDEIETLMSLLRARGWDRK